MSSYTTQGAKGEDRPSACEKRGLHDTVKGHHTCGKRVRNSVPNELGRMIEEHRVHTTQAAGHLQGTRMLRNTLQSPRDADTGRARKDMRAIHNAARTTHRVSATSQAMCQVSCGRNRYTFDRTNTPQTASTATDQAAALNTRPETTLL